MDNPASITLPVRCIRCHGAVTLQFMDWPVNSDPEAAQRVQEWSCPYCKASNLGQYPGQVVWAVPWADPDPDVKT